MERRDIQPRLVKVCDAMGLTDDERRAALANIDLLTQDELGGRYNLIENERQVVRWIRTAQLRVLFIDSLQRTHSGSENDDMPKLCTTLESIARTTGVALEVVHHENKAAAGDRGQWA